MCDLLQATAQDVIPVLYLIFQIIVGLPGILNRQRHQVQTQNNKIVRDKRVGGELVLVLFAVLDEFSMQIMMYLLCSLSNAVYLLQDEGDEVRT